jgi:hypothetical protein
MPKHIKKSKRHKKYKESNGGNKKIRKTRKNLKRRGGGTCYGRGVGANNYDLNYTIYNTNLLKLFPYKA